MLDKFLELLFSLVIMMWVALIFDIGSITLKISNFLYYLESLH